MIDPALEPAWDTTWPAADRIRIGGFQVGRGMGGGGRVSAARRVGPWDAGDIAAAERQHAAWDQPASFLVMEGDSALGDALGTRGYRPTAPTLILRASAARLAAGAVPPVTAIEVWPPLAIQRDLWAAAGIGPARQAVMDRVTGPRTAILGRVEDRAAGVCFVAVEGGAAMLHALAVAPRWRRKGLAGWMLVRAAQFAARHGAGTLALAVSESNAGARALYAAAGFETAGRYHYWRRD